MTESAPPAAALATLHDVARCLALAERAELLALPGGALPRASWRLLHRHVQADQLMGAPRAESDVPALSWLFRSLGMGGFIGAVNGKLRLARTAIDWLGLAADAQLAALQQIWRNTPEVAFVWLPATSGQRERGDVWRAVTHQLVASLGALPPDTWVATTDLLAEVATQTATLRFGVAANLPSVHQAYSRQAARLAGFLLNQVLPRLGLLVVQGEGAARCCAVSAERADWLRQTLPARQPVAGARPTPDQPVERGLADARAPYWRIADDLLLTVPTEAPALATFEVMQFADLASVGPPATYRITRTSLERSLRQDAALPDILFLLARGTEQPLAGPVVAQLTRLQTELTVIHCEPGFRLRPAAPDQLAALQTRKPFRAATELAASGHAAFIGQAESAALLRYLRRAGYVLSLSGPTPTAEEPALTLSAVRRHRLPRVALATLIGFYTKLRSLAPGLAGLNLDDLEHDLSAVLSPTEHAAVQRLIASNCAWLNTAIGQAQTAAAAEDEVAAPHIATSRGPDDTADAAQWLETLGEAIAAGDTLELLYADTQGTVTQRRIRPLRLEERWGRRYLVAHCELRGDERSFRLDRIVAVDRL